MRPHPSRFPVPSALQTLLDTFRSSSLTVREQGTYFEELCVCYFRNEPAYRDLYVSVQTFGAWAKNHGLSAKDTGIDLVATTHTGEHHAIQCKLYAPDYTLMKADIDSFFTASGKKDFSHRIIVSTTNLWSENADDALENQQPPVTKIDLATLENSIIDWASFAPSKPVALKKRNDPRPHQETAILKVTASFKTADRGKLIMACGTGKTFTSLKIAEQMAGEGKTVLFLVPSLALLSQTITEWTQQSALRLQNYAVCSDSDVGKRKSKKSKEADTIETLIHELQYPATTDAARLGKEVAARHDKNQMTVVYSTYHSIKVIAEAQAKHGLPPFDLIICDEAHRTTGATFEDEDESNFVLIHDNNVVKGAKRLYMTATPRVYGNAAKAAAEQGTVALCSMDDEEIYGETFHVLTFSEAVKRGLLVDYKVIVLAIEERHVSRRIQKLLMDDENQLRVDDAARIIGCWKALSKAGLSEGLHGDLAPMKRAVAFCQVIDPPKNAKSHKVASTQIATMFKSVVEAYQAGELEAEPENPPPALRCEAEHVDGSMGATMKEQKLRWLKDETPEDTCRILSNVRCLSEGVDVPALDAVLFLTPRNSQVDVVQSVGRVMRRSDHTGKKRGYIVLPVVIPAGVEPHDALNDNETYRVVWQVLQAIRSHDDRFDAMVNKLDLIGKDPTKMEVIAIADKLPAKQKKAATPSETALANAQGGTAIGTKGKGKKEKAPPQGEQVTLQFEIGEVEKAIYAKLVKKVGNRHHWEEWANDVAKIARTHIDRIKGILENPANTVERDAFHRFAAELRDDLNDSISDDDIVEMLAQHLITKPVFDALFGSYSFASKNPMSQTMQGVLESLKAHKLEKETETLQAFYESVRLRAEGIDSAEGKQKIIVELYDKFFRNAFPKMSERLGIVYTPVEIVDFILKSVDHILRTEFGENLGSEGVHILDPFTGTGTFLTRLLQSGLIAPEDLPRKYASEIHANEIVLLAYYIAAINIEASYHSIAGGEYKPFEGICLTDTFQLYEKDDLISALMVDNSARRTRQKKLDIRVIVGNPPYSVGQDSANDNNQNVAYKGLDSRIGATYALRSSAKNKNALYDSYIRALRWASDRIEGRGVLGFVTNASFIEAATADGLRKCLAEEFSSLYIFHLRGNQRTSGELSRREGGKVFGSGSRAPVAISLLVRNPDAIDVGQIFFHDIGDYRTREEKLALVRAFGDVGGVSTQVGWKRLHPDQHGDWLKQRNDSFSRFIPMGTKNKDDFSVPLFENYSNGVKTQRDAWTINPSHLTVKECIKKTVAVFNSELQRFAASFPLAVDKDSREPLIDDFVDSDPTRISWTRALKNDFAKNKPLDYDDRRVVPCIYRPFTKQWLYFDRRLNEMIYQMPRIFPDSSAKNLMIMVKQRWSGIGQFVLMVDTITELQIDGGAQCFPLYLYSPSTAQTSQEELFDGSAPIAANQRRDAITDKGLAHFISTFPGGQTIGKEDLFYYTYGLLHSADYRALFADDLGKDIPRIPRVKKEVDFWAFATAGRRLGDLHVNYEAQSECPDVAVEAKLPSDKRKHAEAFRVTKMKFGPGKDKSIIIYNEFITVRNIPLEAYEYVVNGKSAIEWVMERQSVTTDKDSGIVKDANDWATETVGDPRYPLSLLLRIITVSLETMKVVKSLPALDIHPDG